MQNCNQQVAEVSIYTLIVLGTLWRAQQRRHDDLAAGMCPAARAPRVTPNRPTRQIIPEAEWKGKGEPVKTCN